MEKRTTIKKYFIINIVLLVWIQNAFGQNQINWKGVGSNRYSQTSSYMQHDNKFKAISAGHTHSLALKVDSTVVAWGSNAEGVSSIPVGLTGVTAIAAGRSHNLALKEDGTVIGWGYNADRQIVIPSDLHDVIAIAAGEDHSLALLKDSTVVTWGRRFSVPVGLSRVVEIGAGDSYSIALKEDGTVVRVCSRYVQNTP